jgi:hypothetical protein
MKAKRELSEFQASVAERVRTLLNEASVQFTEDVVVVPGGEVMDSFVIATRSEIPLTVNFLVLDDQFNVLANGAEIHVYFAQRDPAKESQWVTRAINTVGILIRNDLRIRIRQTLFGRETGAVWVPAGTYTGGWAGDGAAARGKGREYIFPHPWFKTVH